ncbi:hypothetical protein ASF79_01950 [Agreia sp. Leaf335]|nr:hypothetical protein ASF79_01950 [Agreia sp. Leaf335]
MVRLVPDRWRQLGWMDPRPYYSAALRRRILQKIDSSARWRVKNLLIRIGGSYSVMPYAEYATTLNELVTELQDRSTRVIVVGPPDISERYFPGAAAAERLYESAAQALDVETLSLSGVLDLRSDYFGDQFHPNVQGHEKIASSLVSLLNDGPVAVPE